MNKLIRYLPVFLAGASGAILYFFLGVLRLLSRISVPGFLALIIVFAFWGILFAYLYRPIKWPIAIWLSLPYLVVVVLSVRSMMEFNAYVGNHNEVTFSVVYLYASPVIAAAFGVLIGSTRSIRSIILFIGLLVSVVAFGSYIDSYVRVSQSRVGTFEMANEVLRLKVDVNCKYEKYRDRINFFFQDQGGCGDARMTVIGKNPRYRLPMTASWIVDGVEIPQRMLPINGPDDGSMIDKFDDPYAYEDVERWRATIPPRLVNAQQAEFRWGDSSIQVQPEQIETYRKLKTEFDELCRGL
jgi:hypothetical protein